MKKVNIKVLWSSIAGCIVLCLAVFGFVFAEYHTDDIAKYMELHSYVQKDLQENFVGIMPKELPQGNVVYSYVYTPSALNHPVYEIFLRVDYQDEELFDQENKRIRLFDINQKMTVEQKQIYFAVGGSNLIEEKLNDKIRDGLFVGTEIAVVDEKNLRIEYLITSLRDEQTMPKNSERIYRVIAKLES